MPSLLSKFKGNNGKLEVDSPSNLGHQRAYTSVEPSSHRHRLAHDSNDSLGRLPSPDNRDESRNGKASERRGTNASPPSLYPDDDARIRKAFADRMKDSNRRAVSLGTQEDDLTPGPNRAPSRPIPDVPTFINPPPPEMPPNTAEKPVPRSRRNSSTSQVGATAESPPPMETVFPQHNAVSQPASEDGNSSLSLSTSPQQQKDKIGWRRNSQTSHKSPVKGGRGIHPSGGLASALAGSGLALANHAMQQPFVPPPPVPPLPRRKSSGSLPRRPTARPDRHANTAGSRKSSVNKLNNHAGVASKEPKYQSESSEDDTDEDSSPDELDLTHSSAPITGFAVASNKRTADFHALFPTVPEGDYLIDDYGCALQREILIQGRLYISENHLCFHANIFGWTTDLVVPIEDITHLDKRTTAYVIPNAIQISTRTGKYTFSSLLNRDTTYDVIYNIWRSSVRPEGSPRGSLDGPGQTGSFGSVTESLPPSIEKAGKQTKTRKSTQCACGKEGKHYPETAMETVLPGEPEKIYNLMFASGFMKEFMRDEEKLMDIQISDWLPVSKGSKKLTRNMSYVKPLSGGIGPKQTKCELNDEMLHLDYDDYVTMLTTTRTPEVPSGNVFSVKTRTCIMWAGAGITRLVVTTQVEWTGRSFIKGIIERSAIDGQKSYHTSLERAMRAYITAHRAEFVLAGQDAAAVEVAAVLATPTTAVTAGIPMSSEDIRKAMEKERSQRGLQWALDTVEGTAKVARQSFWGAIELIKETWENSSTTAVLWFVVVGLVLSNIWTYFRAQRLEVVARRRVGLIRDEDVQRVVGENVRDAFRVFEEVVRSDGKSIIEEVAEVKRTLETVDARVRQVEDKMEMALLD